MTLPASFKGFCHRIYGLPEAQADIVDKLEIWRGKFPIELVNGRAADAGQVFATVFVPEKQKDYYLKKVAAYRDEDSVKRDPRRRHGRGGSQAKNQLLVASIERPASRSRGHSHRPARSFPAPARRMEIWLCKGTRPAFDTAALALELGVREHSLEFAEREVVIARSTPEQLGRVVAHTDSVAEIRLARDTPSFFMGMHGAEQRAWSADLAGRLVPCADDAPAVCLLDPGTTMGHALIAPYLNAADQQAFDTGWSVEDSAIKSMAGTARRCPGRRSTATSWRCSMAMARWRFATAWNRSRSCPTTVLTILISTAPSPPNRSRGPRSSLPTARVPSASPLRALAIIGADALLLVGQARRHHLRARRGPAFHGCRRRQYWRPDRRSGLSHPQRHHADRNPAQAWNVLTVGAFTERTVITDPAFAGWSALGLAGDIMPRSRTS
jgi:hypothetical protein